MATFTAAGATIAISAGVPATHDQTGFAALTYTVIDEVTDLGNGYSRNYNAVEYSPLATREVQTRKGSYNSGTATIMFAVDFADAGQDLLRTAAASDALHSFKVTLQDGSILYFQALVMGDPITISTIDNIVMQSSDLRIQNGGVVFAS